MHGLPGSGKSTKVQELVNKLPFWLYLSTDNYWIRPDGYYDFNVTRLKEAHRWTFNLFMGIVNNIDDVTDVIIDNTNLSLADCRKYLDNWPKDGKIELVESDAEWRYDVEECFKRNTHGVPLERIQEMRDIQIGGREEILDYISKTKVILHNMNFMLNRE
jgi:hypothetical protein